MRFEDLGVVVVVLLVHVEVRRDGGFQARSERLTRSLRSDKLADYNESNTAER